METVADSAKWAWDSMLDIGRETPLIKKSQMFSVKLMK